MLYVAISYIIKIMSVVDLGVVADLGSYREAIAPLIPTSKNTKN